MPIAPINLGYKSNPRRNRKGGNARLINVYGEEQDIDGKVTMILYAVEGFDGFGSALSGGVIRGESLSAARFTWLQAAAFIQCLRAV